MDHTTIGEVFLLNAVKQSMSEPIAEGSVYALVLFNVSCYMKSSEDVVFALVRKNKF